MWALEHVLWRSLSCSVCAQIADEIRLQKKSTCHFGRTDAKLRGLKKYCPSESNLASYVHFIITLFEKNG